MPAFGMSFCCDVPKGVCWVKTHRNLLFCEGGQRFCHATFWCNGCTAWWPGHAPMWASISRLWCRNPRMSFEIDIGLTLLTGRKDVNEDFAVAMRAEPGRAAVGRHGCDGRWRQHRLVSAHPRSGTSRRRSAADLTTAPVPALRCHRVCCCAMARQKLSGVRFSPCRPPPAAERRCRQFSSRPCSPVFGAAGTH
jgi:hypothetical protein